MKCALIFCNILCAANYVQPIFVNIVSPSDFLFFVDDVVLVFKKGRQGLGGLIGIKGILLKVWLKLDYSAIISANQDYSTFFKFTEIQEQPPTFFLNQREVLGGISMNMKKQRKVISNIFSQKS